MNFFAKLLERSRNRRIYSDLMMMDDHLLRDMGITRAEAANMARGRKANGLRSHE